jgi:hypothetical protein
MSGAKRLVLCASLAAAGCTNFDALVERACASGRCGGDIVSNDPPVLVADHLLLDFGQTTSDGQPKQRLTLTNVDGGTADSLTFNFMGPAATNFALSSNGCTSLTPGESCPVDDQLRALEQRLHVADAR